MSGDKREDANVAAALAATEGLAPGEFIALWEQLATRFYGQSLPKLVNLEQLRLLRDLHSVVVRRVPPSADLLAAARNVVDVVGAPGKDWRDIKAAVGNLADILGVPANG